MEVKEAFILDNINNETRIGDKVVFLSYAEDSKPVLAVAKVMGIRVKEGNYEANAAGTYGGWKREFYRVLKKKEISEDENQNEI